MADPVNQMWSFDPLTVQSHQYDGANCEIKLLIALSWKISFTFGPHILHIRKYLTYSTLFWLVCRRATPTSLKIARVLHAQSQVLDWERHDPRVPVSLSQESVNKRGKVTNTTCLGAWPLESGKLETNREWGCTKKIRIETRGRKKIWWHCLNHGSGLLRPGVLLVLQFCSAV